MLAEHRTGSAPNRGSYRAVSLGPGGSLWQVGSLQNAGNGLALLSGRAGRGGAGRASFPVTPAPVCSTPAGGFAWTRFHLGATRGEMRCAQTLPALQFSRRGGFKYRALVEEALGSGLRRPLLLSLCFAERSGRRKMRSGKALKVGTLY